MPHSAAPTLEGLLDCRCDVPGCNQPLDAHLADLYTALKAGRLDRCLFHDALDLPFGLFKKIVRSKDVWCYAGWSKETGTPLALALLDRFQGRTPYLHFTFFRGERFERRIEIGRAFMGFIFTHGSNLACLLALTPVKFRHSWRYGLDLGFERLGVIPGACTLADRRNGTLACADGMLLKLDNPNL